VADIFSDGMTRVAYVAAISNQAAPTTTELNLGILLQSLITADGLVGFEATTADVDNSALDSTFDTVGIGRDSYSGTLLRLKKQTVGADTAYATLIRGATGYIVIRRDVASTTAWTAGDAVEVYPIVCGRRKRLSPEKNTVTRYEVPTKITSAPSPDATVV
jgi:hypothetical protein